MPRLFLLVSCTVLPSSAYFPGRPLVASGSSSLSCALDGCKADLRLSRTASRGMFNGRRRVGQSRYREQIQEAIVIESAAYALPAGYRRACQEASTKSRARMSKRISSSAIPACGSGPDQQVAQTHLPDKPYNQGLRLCDDISPELG